ncbi:hypothetical protein CALVIDRAFT_178483 [Calocera viscosa TUFC12733]|uniref:F-box domain-containing protein n=1 Tax=Calocera viscosa (strain TUFC12733) TaxID=1330018 RepID=A0A167KYF5_CALVF|nr:hypothetical protein CALVIDRAFT_178483 [Calocera viscosa TUFC12733]
MLRILKLPAEVLDVIIEHIYSPLDLLSLASTCKRLRDLVLHDHLDWRSISVLFEDIPYLQSILGTERRTSLVQRLRIQSYEEQGDPITGGFRRIRPMTRKEPTVEELVKGLASLSNTLCSIRTLDLNVDALDFGHFDGFFAALRRTSPFFTNLSISASLVVGEAHEKRLEQTQSVIWIFLPVLYHLIRTLGHFRHQRTNTLLLVFRRLL